MNRDDIATVILVVGVLVWLIGLVIGIFYLLTLQRSIERCAPPNRALSPGQVWLSLIPLFNIVWQFILVTRIAETLDREFRSRGTPQTLVPDDYGRKLGLAVCILCIVSVIPFIGIITALAAVVCWILYWVKIAGYSQSLALGTGGAMMYIPPPVEGQTPLQLEEQAQVQQKVSPDAQWLVALVLVFGWAASYLQRLAMSVLMPVLRDELHLTSSQFGLIFSALVWGLIAGYVVMTVLTWFGGARWGLVAAFAGMSLASCATGFIPNYTGLIATRFVLGLFTGGLLPAAFQSARDWFRSSERPLLIGAMLAASPVAGLLAPPFLTYCQSNLHMTWRVLMIITGVPTLIAAVLGATAWPADPEREAVRGVSRAGFAAAAMLALGGLFASPVYTFATNWLPILSRQYPGSPSSFSSTSNLVVLGASCCGALLAGMLLWAMGSGGTSGSSRAQGGARAILLTIFGFLLPVVALGGLAKQWFVAGVLAALSAAAYSAISTILYSAVADTLPAGGVAVGAAIGALLSSLSGMVSNMGFAWMTRSGDGTLFLTVGAVGVLGVAGILLLAWQETEARSQ